MRRRKRGRKMKLKQKPKRKAIKRVIAPKKSALSAAAKCSCDDFGGVHLDAGIFEAYVREDPFGMKKEQTLNTAEELAAAVAKMSSTVRFEVRRDAQPCELKTFEREFEKLTGQKIASKRKVVYFVPIGDVKMGECVCVDASIAQCNAVPSGFLVIGSTISVFSPFIWTMARLRRSLLTITSNCVGECTMCFEEVCTGVKCVSGECRNSLSCNQCGAHICYVCVWKIALENRELMLKHPHYASARFQCPVCRFDRNLFQIPDLCSFIVMQNILRELDEELHTEVIENAKLSDTYAERRQRPTSCSRCHKPFASKRAAKRALTCGKCKHSRYCNRKCRSKDRESHEHKERCRLWCLH